MQARVRSLSAPYCRANATSSSNDRTGRFSSLVRMTHSLAFFLLLLQFLGLLMGESDALPQHQQRFASDSYAKHARADPDAEFHLAIGLHVRDFDALERKLWHVSDPRYVGSVRFVVCGMRSLVDDDEIDPNA